MTLKKVKHDPLAPAKVDLVGMVRTANLKDTGAVVDYFGRRFLSVPLAVSDRTRLVEYLNGRLGKRLSILTARDSKRICARRCTWF